MPFPTALALLETRRSLNVGWRRDSKPTSALDVPPGALTMMNSDSNWMAVNSDVSDRRASRGWACWLCFSLREMPFSRVVQHHP